MSHEVSFSSKALVELMQAAFEKNALFRFKATGFSMLPFIKDGDMVTFSTFDSRHSLFGKVAAFCNPKTGRLAVHRIIGRSGNGYFLKGDGLFGVDGLIPTQNIVGVVIKVEREGKIIYFGLGLERFAIAFLSKIGFIRWSLWCWRLLPCGMRDFIKCRVLS